jgi:hypothetical protein
VPHPKSCLDQKYSHNWYRSARQCQPLACRHKRLYCTILIYSVVMRHRRPYRNWNVVDVTGHEGVYRMPILSQMSNLGNIWWKNANFRRLIIKFYRLRFLRPFGHKMQAKITHESTKSVPNLPKNFQCHGICRCLPKCQIHQMCHSHRAIPNRLKSYSMVRCCPEQCTSKSSDTVWQASWYVVYIFKKWFVEKTASTVQRLSLAKAEGKICRWVFCTKSFTYLNWTTNS